MKKEALFIGAVVLIVLAVYCGGNGLLQRVLTGGVQW
jgi:hypothetical protein